MRILPGDPNKQSLRDRGLTFEMILEAIDSGGLLDVLPDTAHPGQVVLAVEISGYPRKSVESLWLMVERFENQRLVDSGELTPRMRQTHDVYRFCGVPQRSSLNFQLRFPVMSTPSPANSAAQTCA